MFIIKYKDADYVIVLNFKDIKVELENKIVRDQF